MIKQYGCFICFDRGTYTGCPSCGLLSTENPTHLVLNHMSFKPKAPTSTTDPVNQPQHYASGEIECIDAIRASMTKEAFCGYLKGNVQKYMWRYEKKINPVEDIKKARWYSERLIKELEDA